jgi:hypothetical protein
MSSKQQHYNSMRVMKTSKLTCKKMNIKGQHTIGTLMPMPMPVAKHPNVVKHPRLASNPMRPILVIH